MISKAIFYIDNRACPTNGSDCGTFVPLSHNLTLFVGNLPILIRWKSPNFNGERENYNEDRIQL